MTARVNPKTEQRPINIQDFLLTHRAELIAALSAGQADQVRGILQSAIEQYPAYAGTIQQLVNASIARVIMALAFVDAEIAGAIADHKQTFALVQQLMKDPTPHL